MSRPLREIDPADWRVPDLGTELQRIEAANRRIERWAFRCQLAIAIAFAAFFALGGPILAWNIWRGLSAAWGTQ